MILGPKIVNLKGTLKTMQLAEDISGPGSYKYQFKFIPVWVKDQTPRANNE